MGDKKHLLRFMGFIAVIGLIIFTFLKFRLYEAFYQVLEKIFGSKNHMFHLCGAFYIVLEKTFRSIDFIDNLKDYLMVISSGIFTSAIVTIFVTIVDYFYARHKVLRRIFFAAEDLEHSFARIKYIFPDEPRELVEDLFCEIDENESKRKSNQQLLEKLKASGDTNYQTTYEKFKLPLKNEAREKFKQYLWEHEKDDIKSTLIIENIQQEYLEDCCDEKIKKYTEQIEKVIQSYLVFDSIRTRELRAAYEELDFLTKSGQKNIRNYIYNNLYTKIVKQVNAVKEANFRFNLYFAGKSGNRGYKLDFIWKLQDMFVSEDDNFYYRQFMYDIDTQMVQVLIFSDGIDKHKDEFPDKKSYIITTKTGAVERILAESKKRDRHGSSFV